MRVSPRKKILYVFRLIQSPTSPRYLISSVVCNYADGFAGVLYLIWNIINNRFNYLVFTKIKIFCYDKSCISKTSVYCFGVRSILFYGTNYLFKPIRLYKTIKNIIINKHESRGEMALAQMIKRFYFVFKSSKKNNLQRQN